MSILGVFVFVSKGPKKRAAGFACQGCFHPGLVPFICGSLGPALLPEVLHGGRMAQSGHQCPQEKEETSLVQHYKQEPDNPPGWTAVPTGIFLHSLPIISPSLTAEPT